MRALAVTNPNATAMTARTLEVIVRALGSELKVDVARTTARGHATELAAGARADGVDVVVALGGDGTVNEVVNGLLRAGPGSDVPRLAVVPGGSANVFARALGLPAQPIEAAGMVLERLRTGQARSIGLGRLSGEGPPRWFTFCAGFGLDAEVVRAVDRHRRLGAKATPILFARSTLRQFLRTDRQRPALTVRCTAAGGTTDSGPLFMLVVTNTTPWTYFRDRPLQPTPEASFDTGLDVFALRRLGLASTAATTCRLLGGGVLRDRRSLLLLHDATRLEVSCSRPVAVQVDGEFVGERRIGSLEAIPHALTVVS
jgi:diacylglycerol kinase family enzyme